MLTPTEATNIAETEITIPDITCVVGEHPGLSDFVSRTKTMKTNLDSTIEDALTLALGPPSATNAR